MKECMNGEIFIGLLFLNQARAGRRPARAWFLEITFILPKYVCVCVSTPEAINN